MRTVFNKNKVNSSGSKNESEFVHKLIKLFFSFWDFSFTLFLYYYLQGITRKQHHKYTSSLPNSH